MNKELKEEWITELRSGNHKQGTRRLRTKDDEFCCLGVLCEILVNKGQMVSVYDEYQGAWRYGVEVASAGSLALFTGNVDGVDLNGTLPGDKEGQNLARLNDEGKTFEEIADIIEVRF